MHRGNRAFILGQPFSLKSVYTFYAVYSDIVTCILKVLFHF